MIKPPGYWRVNCYQSGTMVVSEAKTYKTPYGVGNTTPYLYVYGPGGDSEAQSNANRFQCCEDLAAFLNGEKPRPAWMEDLERVSETLAVGIDRTSIQATGPCIDNNPPACDWREDCGEAARDRRARLMDRLFLA